MIAGAALVEAVAGLPSRPAEGTAYRAISARFLRTALSAIGSYRRGARYNAPGSFEALYLADNQYTALLETRRLIAIDAGLLPVRGPSQVLLTVRYALAAVADLTDSAAHEALGTGLQELTGDWRFLQGEGRPVPTQCLGAALHARGDLDGFLVPSAQNLGGANLVVIPERLVAGKSWLRVEDDSGLIDAALP